MVTGGSNFLASNDCQGALVEYGYQQYCLNRQDDADQRQQTSSPQPVAGSHGPPGCNQQNNGENNLGLVESVKYVVAHLQRIWQGQTGLKPQRGLEKPDCQQESNPQDRDNEGKIKNS